MLVDDGDAERPRLLRRIQHDGIAADEDAPCRGLGRAADDADQGRLARAVFPKQSMDFAAPDRKIDAVERARAGEFLDQPPDFENGLRIDRRPLRPVRYGQGGGSLMRRHAWN